MARTVEEIENELEALIEEFKTVATQNDVRDFLHDMANPDGWEEDEEEQ